MALLPIAASAVPASPVPAQADMPWARVLTQPHRDPTVIPIPPNVEAMGVKMPMSEEERRLLKEVELGLIVDDPHLAMELLSGYPARRFRPGFYPGSVAGLLGCVLFVAGVGSGTAEVVAIGSFLVLFGTWLLLDRRAFRHGRRHSQPR